MFYDCSASSRCLLQLNILTEDEDLAHQDEVFEAIIRFSEIAEEEGDDLDSLIEDKKKLKESSQAKKVKLDVE